VEAVVGLLLQTGSTPFIGSYVAVLQDLIVEMGRVTLEKIAPPVPEIVAAVLPLLPIAAMALVTGVKAVPPVQRTVAAARLQPSAAMGPATEEKIVRHVHKTVQAHIHATIAPLQPGRPHPGWSVERHVEI
jgi:hypothetical protein